MRVITLRAAGHAGQTWAARAVAVIVAAATLWFVLQAPLPRDAMVWAGLAGIFVALVLGAPVFVALGGAALLLFWGEDLPVASLAVDHYRLVVNPSLPAIPLFTLAGYLLAESGAPKRLIRVFNAMFGSVRGGAAAVAICAGAFFTAFTGGSGVTILALGGLLLPLLIGVGQSERNALGLITSSSALGVLLPPSLPLILFAIVAKVPMDRMFLGALLPGLVLMLLLFALGWRTSRPASRAPRAAAGELRQALWAAKWELLLPVVAFVALFGGFATPVEAAAFTALYAVLLTTVLHRDLHLLRDVPRVSAEAGLVIGSVLLILGVALGFTNYLVDAQVPDRLVEWTTANIESRWVFLAVLNLSLLLVGCFMDAFSAIVVVVPIIVPVASGLRRRPDPPGRDLPRQHGAGLPDAAGGHEPVLRLLPLRQTGAGSRPRGCAVHAGHRARGGGGHLCALAHQRAAFFREVVDCPRCLCPFPGAGVLSRQPSEVQQEPG